MDRQVDYGEIAPAAYEGLSDVGEFVASSSLDDTLVELVALVMTVVQINSWNRLWVTFRTPEIPPLGAEGGE
jgi:hypothetical protein